MKIGIVCECGPDGAEKKVFPKLSYKLGFTHEFEFATMSNKADLISGCGKAVTRLFADGMQRVAIMWDLKPAWPEKGGRLDCVKERDAIVESLAHEGLTAKKVKLICIDKELDSWFLCDGHAISTVLSRPAHPVKYKGVKNPVSVQDPKGLLKKLFETHGRHTYIDRIHGLQIVNAIENVNKLLTRSQSFCRFQDLLR
jgi:hypothetical protein